MQIKIFTIPILGGKELNEQLNSFLRSRRILQMDEASFRRFTEMRQIRKQLAQEEGIPAYAIFTDEEMAELAKLEKRTSANMRKLKGIGPKKMEKFVDILPITI